MGRLTSGRIMGWLTVAFACAAAYDGFHLLRASQVNRALGLAAAGDPVQADDPHLEFARAWGLQQRGDFQGALKAYAAIDVPADDPMQADIKFNLANLYFRRALALKEERTDDLAFPLVELAKQNYLELLRVDRGDWDAKYNLELALAIAPETELADVEEERNPEHNPRAAAGIQVREPLP
ncbi:hypothetical protein BH24PSE2_BH24PSE2_00180 [soil metagenome]